jgi:hypothetical protein
MIEVLASYLISYYALSIPIHEAGHLLFGLLTGLRFQAFRLLSFVWVKENGKLTRKKSKLGIVVVGQCLMAPPEKEEDFKFVLYNLGGGLLNLICCLVAIIPLVFVRGFGTAEYILAGFSAAQLTMALVNLIPINLVSPNDGYNVMVASRSPDAKHGMYVMLRVNDELANGKRYREYDESAFLLSNSADLSNFFTAYVPMCEAARLYDMGRYEESLAILQMIPLYLLPRYYRNSVFIEYLYDAMIRHPDFEKAKELYEKKGMKAMLRMQIPMMFRVQCAYAYFIKRDDTEAKEYLAKAKASLTTYENKGMCIMEADYIAELENLMEQR